MKLHPDQMIISVEEYDSFIAEKEQFKEDKKKHEDENLVLTTYQGLDFTIKHWATYGEAMKSVKHKKERDVNKKFASMSVLQFIKWKRNA